jgi:hypothetical protein
MKTEESQRLSCHVVWLDPSDPDPNPPRYIRRDRWQYIPFSTPIILSEASLAKLARASDPRSSSFVVYPNSDNILVVWGLIDQGNSYNEFVNFGASSGHLRPGLFSGSITDVGKIIAHIGMVKIAELKLSDLVTVSYDVLRKGPVFNKLQHGIAEYVNAVYSRPDAPKRVRQAWRSNPVALSIATLNRLLLRIQNHGHGGTVLITPDHDQLHNGLNVKYRIDYPRLSQALQELIFEELVSDKNFEKIESYLGNGRPIPGDLYVDDVILHGEIDDSRLEIDGCVWFISLLSRVDGLVLLSPQLEVKGFGVEITYGSPPDNVYAATDELASENKLKAVDYNHFGTRHRSTMRYCWAVPNSIGFVISQDGDVRAITRLNDKLILWENIRLRLDDQGMQQRRATPRIPE